MTDSPKVFIVVDGKDPMEVFVDFDVMARVESYVNISERRQPENRVDFLDIVNDAAHRSMDRFRALAWLCLITKNKDVTLEGISEVYQKYVKAYVPVERDSKDGKSIITIGAMDNFMNQIVTATDNFLGPNSKARAKEKEPPLVETPSQEPSTGELS